MYVSLTSSIKRRRTAAWCGIAMVALSGAIPYLAQARPHGVPGDPPGFMPHGMCYLWDPRLIALQIVSDALIAAAYFSIPVLLVYFVHKRPDVPFGAIFWMFGIFIIACGSTHVLDIWTVWHPAYWLSGAVKALTAAASLTTAVTLIPLIPKALNYKSPADLVQQNLDYLKFVTDATEALAAPRSGQTLLDALLATIVPGVADCAVVNLIEAGSTVRAVAVRGRPDLAEPVSRVLGTSYVELDGTSPSAVAIRTGKTQVLESCAEPYLRDILDERFVDVFRRLAGRFAIVVPLIFEDVVLGTLLVARSGDESHAFNDAEIVMFETLARRTAVAMRNLEKIEALAHAASHDALTGLANRRLLTEEVTVALQRYRRNDRELAAVLYLDVDRFKRINDSLGHTIGDLLLVAIGRRLEGCIRTGDTLARVSGDEFVMLLCDIGSEAGAQRIGQRIFHALAEPFSIEGHEMFVTGSIGIALATLEHATCEEIMRDADIAMYRAKTLGKHRCAIFEPAMRAEALARMEIDTELRRALERDEFEVFYQPILACTSGDIDGFEALVRWRHPSRGLIPPVDFIAIAEETGSIVALGSHVLRAACMQTRRWHETTPDRAHLSVNVNVSPKQLREPDYVANVRSILAETRCDPTSLHLEITETVLMDERSRLAGTLRELRALGVRVDIDDFGTGYSSLAYLHAFPLDALKIDRSFVSGTSKSLTSPEIVKTILSLAKSLELSVVAEGVETFEQAAELRALGCDRLQGFLYSKPMNASAATAYLAGFTPHAFGAATIA